MADDTRFVEPGDVFAKVGKLHLTPDETLDYVRALIDGRGEQWREEHHKLEQWMEEYKKRPIQREMPLSDDELRWSVPPGGTVSIHLRNLGGRRFAIELRANGVPLWRSPYWEESSHEQRKTS